MKTVLLILVLMTSLSGIATAEHHDASFHHVVCFKFKEEATAEQIAAIEKSFAALPSKIDTIKGLDWGTDVSKEGRAKGFSHCFIVKFADQAGLDVYLPHEAHQAFVKELRPILDDVFVIDFVAR